MSVVHQNFVIPYTTIIWELGFTTPILGSHIYHVYTEEEVWIVEKQIRIAAEGIFGVSYTHSHSHWDDPLYDTHY